MYVHLMQELAELAQNCDPRKRWKAFVEKSRIASIMRGLRIIYGNNKTGHRLFVSLALHYFIFDVPKLHHIHFLLKVHDFSFSSKISTVN